MGRTSANRSATVSWAEIMRLGVCVALRVRFFRGTKVIDPDELRIPPEVKSSDEFRRLFSLGRKSIAPARNVSAARGCETAARQAISEASYDTPFGRFVPRAAWRELAAVLAQHEVRFWSLLDQLVGSYEESRGEVLAGYRQAFKEFQLAPEILDAMLEAIEHAWPSPADLRSSTRWQVAVYRIETENLAAGAAPADVKDEIAATYEREAGATASSSLETIAAQFREVVGQWAAKVAKLLEGREKIPIRTELAMRRAIHAFERLDILGDAEVRAALDAAKALLSEHGGSASAPDAEDVREQVQRLAEIAAAPLDEARIGARLIALHIPDVSKDRDSGTPVDPTARARLAALVARLQPPQGGETASGSSTEGKALRGPAEASDVNGRFANLAVDPQGGPGVRKKQKANDDTPKES